MSTPRQRALAIGPLRAFAAVARLLSFRAAAEELHLTQPAISRQIKTLEEELGASLFARGTRHVELTRHGAVLQRACVSALDRLDGAVRQIRQSRGRRVVNVTTFASFASLWLIPRLEAFQREHPDIDIRVSATDIVLDIDDGEMDLALRYITAAPAHSHRLFGETLTPVISPWLAEQVAQGQRPPMRVAADLAEHTLAEEDDQRPSAEFLSWRRWLAEQGQPGLNPRRWMYLNFTYQQVQAALTGQAVALARVALVAESLERGELVEPFGPAGRLDSPLTYWLAVADESRQRPEVQQFCQWVLAQAALTRRAIGEADLS